MYTSPAQRWVGGCLSTLYGSALPPRLPEQILAALHYGIALSSFICALPCPCIAWPTVLRSAVQALPMLPALATCKPLQIQPLKLPELHFAPRRECLQLPDCPHLIRIAAPLSEPFGVRGGWIDVHVMCTLSGAGPSDMPNFCVKRFGARIPTCVSLPPLL